MVLIYRTGGARERFLLGTLSRCLIDDEFFFFRRYPDKQICCLSLRMMLYLLSIREVSLV